MTSGGGRRGGGRRGRRGGSASAVGGATGWRVEEEAEAGAPGSGGRRKWRVGVGGGLRVGLEQVVGARLGRVGRLQPVRGPGWRGRGGRPAVRRGCGDLLEGAGEAVSGRRGRGGVPVEAGWRQRRVADVGVPEAAAGLAGPMVAEGAVGGEVEQAGLGGRGCGCAWAADGKGAAAGLQNPVEGRPASLRDVVGQEAPVEIDGDGPPGRRQ